MAEYLTQLWQVLLDLSPSLLLGLGIAGLLHVWLPPDLIHRGLSRPDLGSVTRAALIGVPLPLCSCGVIPTALGLHREGASRGATTAFMVSTPQTGVDSILVSAAFLGWPFAIFKVIAAFLTGLVAGVLVNRFEPPSRGIPTRAPGTPGEDRGGLRAALRYAVVDLLGAIDTWLIGGVLVAALITTLTPPDFFAGQPWANGFLGMLVVLSIALPLYVCTTASVPIAASLIAAGMPAGSALVFLMAGPATNVATIGAVYRTLGARVLAIYVGTVAILSLLFGLLFDAVLAAPAGVRAAAHVHGTDWVAVVSALVLLGLLGWLAWRRRAARRAALSAPVQADSPAETLLQVQGMSCGHCVATVKRALEALDGVDSAEPELATGLVRVRGGLRETGVLIAAVEAAGFKAGPPPD